MVPLQKLYYIITLNYVFKVTIWKVNTETELAQNVKMWNGFKYMVFFTLYSFSKM